MNAPIKLVMEQARAKVDNRGELPYSVRMGLLRALDNSATGKENGELGWTRRALLAINCARSCSGLWLTENSEINLDAVLNFAEQCMREKNMHSELRDVAENLKVEVDNVLARGESHHPAAYAGFAAVASSWAVLRDECIDHTVENEKVLDVSKWSSAFWASCACSGGATWQESTDDAARRKFWLWYLDDAIPRVLD